MSEATGKKIRNAIGGQVLPGSIIRNASDTECKYWKSKGWIKLSGRIFTLTKKGYNELPGI